MNKRNCRWTALIFLSVSCITGCGGDSTTEPVTASGTGASAGDSSAIDSSTGSTSNALPSAAIKSAAGSVDDDQRIARPEPDTPEGRILEITELRLKPFPETDDVEELRQARRERNREIVKLATAAIAATHEQPEKQQLFNVAVHRLMDATFQLAVQGDQESVDALFGHADSLYQRDPKSRAAAEAAWFVARFANENAARFGRSEPRWIAEFSRQARAFADRFPTEQRRAVGLLNDAAASCDFHGAADEAIQCYAAIREKYPDTPQAAQAVAPLRRLQLAGKPLDLGGPTLDGGFLSVADFKGSPVLIVFWSSQARPFVEQAKSAIATAAKFEARGLNVIGVNLDVDEAAIDAFNEKFGLSWRTIFHADPARRGWNNPVATYYGVTSIPQYWLVDRSGNVVTTNVRIDGLDAALEKLVPAAEAP